MTTRLYPICLSTQECATALGVSKKIIHEMVRAGLPRRKIGTKTRIFTDELASFCKVYFKQQQTTESPQ